MIGNAVVSLSVYNNKVKVIWNYESVKGSLVEKLHAFWNMMLKAGERDGQGKRNIKNENRKKKETESKINK